MSYIPTRRLFVLSVALALFVLAVLAGCALDPAPAPTPTPPPPTPTPLPRGGTLSIRLAGDVPELRPWQPRSRGEEQITSMLYSGLTRLDAQLQPQPDLATAWSASADGRLITFTLRADTVWHDGRPLTADDVVYTLGALRELSPTTALLDDVRRIAEMTAPATNTVVLSLTERYAPIFADLTVPILPKHLLIGKNIATLNFWETPIGSGPFQFGERKPGASVTLNANSRFYRGQPLLDHVAFLDAEPKVAVDALRDGRLLLAELPWSEGRAISGTIPSIRAGAYPENGYYFLAFNVREARPFADPRVRQALAEAIDLPRLVREATGGQGIPIASDAAPGSWADFARPLSATVNLDHARTLLDEAGWKLPEGGGAIRQQDGITFTAQLFVRADDARRVRAAELIAAAARQIGLTIVVQRADFDTVIVSKYAPPYDFDLLLGSWSNGAGDPDYADYAFYDPDDLPLFHSSQVNQGLADTRATLNITGFKDGTYDNQAAAAHQLYDFAERGNFIRLAQQRLVELKPYLFLWADRIPVALSPKVTTLDGPISLDTPMYLENVERWYLRK
ncbi:MAG: peptide ABC transporter substrate-binding protein [Roseiflexaceae bacterium]